jgi:mono/diheme cytochrome c family protein
MMTMTTLRRILTTLAIPALMAAAGCGGGATGGAGGGDSTSSSTTTTASTGTSGGDAARGKYLVDNVIVCGQCHTPTLADGTFDQTKYLAGSKNYNFKYQSMDVTVIAENITPDNVQGVGMWTDDQIRGAIQAGLDDQKATMWAIMPYPEYAVMEGADVSAIVAYLRTVPGNANVVPPDSLEDPGSPAAPINGSKVPHTTLAKTDPDFASAERGRYLAILGCMSCHTEETDPGVPDVAKAFAGGRTFKSVSDAKPSTSTNLTPDASGLAGWSAADIVASIKTNTEKGTNRQLCSAMPGGKGHMGDMTDADLLDIGNYLHTIAPVANGPFKCQP